jgi:hypothetical protein
MFSDFQMHVIGVPRVAPFFGRGNGAFRRLEDAIRRHLDVFRSARSYNPRSAGIERDLTFRLGLIEPVLDRTDLLLAYPIQLEPDEFQDLITSCVTACWTNVRSDGTSAN